jgi:hypothetical protein
VTASRKVRLLRRLLVSIGALANRHSHTAKQMRRNAPTASIAIIEAGSKLGRQ